VPNGAFFICVSILEANNGWKKSFRLLPFDLQAALCVEPRVSLSGSGFQSDCCCEKQFLRMGPVFFIHQSLVEKTRLPKERNGGEMLDYRNEGSVMRQQGE
jgi:hypothetical protein